MRSGRRVEGLVSKLGRLAACAAMLGLTLRPVAAEPSNTYRPQLPTRLNKAYLAGEKLWKSRKIVGPGGKTCAGCHETPGGQELRPLELLRKRGDLSKLIYFEIVTRCDNNVVRPDGAEVAALATYLVERFKLDKRAPAAASDVAGLRLAEGRQHYASGDYSRALAALEEALKAGPEPRVGAEAHLLVGVIAQVLGDEIRARAEFFQVFELQPDWALDPQVFSPKTIELFESVRSAHAGAAKEDP